MATTVRELERYVEMLLWSSRSIEEDANPAIAVQDTTGDQPISVEYGSHLCQTVDEAEQRGVSLIEDIRAD